MRDPHIGAAIEVISSLRDVTSRKTLEAELEAARSRAEQAAKAKSVFLANMSHEIRTPMNGVVGFTDLLLAGPFSDDQRRHTELIAESGRAMMRLLNDILDLSKVEAGQMGLADETFDLPHALKACLKLVTPAVAQKGLGLECELAGDLPKLVCGDGLRLRQIVLNLLGNATKFTAQGQISLRAWPESRETAPVVIIEVEDSGIGIPPDRQAAIFDPFVQADNQVAPRYGGTGLGLAISVQLACLMGGTLEVESEVGTGTLFRLTLPLPTADERRLLAREGQTDLAFPSNAVSARRSLHVLVAEDHDVNQMLISAMLTQLGCDCDIASDGARAVEMVREAAEQGAGYDIVLMDMQMPLVDGVEATRQVRGAGFDADMLPILALTANAYADDIASCLHAGMQAHLAKPLQLERLRDALRRWAGLSSASAGTPASLSPEIQERYRIRKKETLDKLGEMGRLGRFIDADLADAIDLLHKLAGSAGMFGEAELGERARELEAGLLEWGEEELLVKAQAGIGRVRAAAYRGVK